MSVTSNALLPPRHRHPAHPELVGEHTTLHVLKSEKMSDSMPHRRQRKDDDPKMIGLWKIGRTIGKGSSGALSLFGINVVLNVYAHRTSEDRTSFEDRPIRCSQDRLETSDSQLTDVLARH